MSENTPNMSSDEVDVSATGSGSVALRLNKNQIRYVGAGVLVLVAALLVWNFVFTGPNFADMITNASHEIHSGSYSSADALLNEEIAKNTSNVHNYNAIAYYDLGVSAQQRGDNVAAISFYEQCIKLAPNYRNAWYNKACL